jgi:large subunit ribosomal protein L18
VLKQFDRKGARGKRHRRVRVRVTGSAQRPRLSVYRSLHHVYAQLIDDDSGRTLAAASTLDLKAGKKDADAAAAVGKSIAERAREAGVSAVVFDRGCFLYHGRVKALADAAREAGLEF